MSNKFFNIKQAGSALMIIIIIGVLAALNFFSYRFFYRFDLTENKDYSLSEASKQMAGKLGETVNIKAYFSGNLPGRYINLKQEVGDILDEYASYSNGKIKIEFIDPEGDEKIKSELYGLGVPELQFNVLEKDKYQAVNGYLGMVINYGDKNEVIPVVEGTKNLEYQITLAVKKLTAETSAVVGLLVGKGAADPDREIALAAGELKKVYDVREVDLADGKEIPADIDTLIIAGPKEKFSEDELKALDKFLIGSHSLLLLIDGVKVGEGLSAVENDTGIEKLLENYGIRLNRDLVLDASSAMASFSQGFVTFSLSYPFWPKIRESGFDETAAATAELESLVLPWVSSLDVLNEKMGDNKISYLVKSSKHSWVQGKDFDLNPQQAWQAENEGERNLAVSVFGKIKSAYGQGEGEGRLAIVGDSDFLRDNFIRQYPDNLIFFQNLVDSLSLDEELINIRSKGITERPIKETSDKIKAAVRYGNIFGMTFLAMAFGLARYFLRRRVR